MEDLSNTKKFECVICGNVDCTDANESFNIMLYSFKENHRSISSRQIMQKGALIALRYH